jgi:hypothetical protein
MPDTIFRTLPDPIRRARMKSMLVSRYQPQLGALHALAARYRHCSSAGGSEDGSKSFGSNQIIPRFQPKSL